MKDVAVIDIKEYDRLKQTVEDVIAKVEGAYFVSQRHRGFCGEEEVYENTYIISESKAVEELKKALYEKAISYRESIKHSEELQSTVYSLKDKIGWYRFGLIALTITTLAGIFIW